MINYKNYSDKDRDFVEDSITEEAIVDSIDETEEEDSTWVGRVTADAVYVRSKPTKQSEPITTVSKGGELMILDSDVSDWYHVMLASGVEGYVMSDFVKE